MFFLSTAISSDQVSHDLMSPEKFLNYKDAGSTFFVGFPKLWRFLRPQLERAMPKRLDEARVLAAVAADDLRGNATLLAATSRPCC